MCGILGIVGSIANSIEDNHILNALDSIRHRGHDDSGIWRDKDAIFGHTRLSIIDLSEMAHQPMLSENKGHILVYNGEVYNFLELREELSKKGIHFKSSGDTEVVLAALIHWGEKALNKFNGMFAIAWYDCQTKELVLARDRFGVKPLFYEETKGGVVFSSEIKAIKKLYSNQTIDLDSVSVYFTIGYNYAPRTIWKNICKLPGGYFLKWKNGKSELRKWYEPNQMVEKIKDWKTGKLLLRRELEDAVKIRLLSDVPVGAFLSGGIDSSIVVGLMSQFSKRSVKTFTVAYNDFVNYNDDSKYARLISRRFKTDHTEIMVTPEKVKSFLPNILDSLDEPFADAAYIPTYIMCKEVKKYVTVALSGDGADEVFAGYSKYLGEYYMKKWWVKIAHPFLKNLSNILPASYRNPFTQYNRRIKRFLSGIETNPVFRHLKWMSLSTGANLNDVINNITQVSTNIIRSDIEKLFQEVQEDDILNKILHTDQSILLEGDMLPKIDFASMQNSLEVRSPFLDFRIIELVNSMPGNFKLRNGKKKAILLEVCSDLLPKKILIRRKQGFNIPIGEWFRNEYKDMFWDIITTAHNKGGLNIKPIDIIYKEHLTEKFDNSRVLWLIFVWSWWWSKHF